MAIASSSPENSSLITTSMRRGDSTALARTSIYDISVSPTATCTTIEITYPLDVSYSMFDSPPSPPLPTSARNASIRPRSSTYPSIFSRSLAGPRNTSAHAEMCAEVHPPSPQRLSGARVTVLTPVFGPPGSTDRYEALRSVRKTSSPARPDLSLRELAQGTTGLYRKPPSPTACLTTRIRHSIMGSPQCVFTASCDSLI